MSEEGKAVKIDFLAGVDANDVHFQIVRLPAPASFDSGEVEITYKVGGSTELGPGSVRANLGCVSATMAIDGMKSFEQSDAGVPGKLIERHRFGSLRGASPEGDWSASGAYVIHLSFGFPLSQATFDLNSVTVPGSGINDIAFTRQVFYGARLEFLTGCAWTPITSAHREAGRIEERAFGRRITVRCLREKDEKTCATAVVYDGPPLDEAESQALWLTLSFLAGARLQTVVTETFDAAGVLIERTYRPGVAPGAHGDAPFHIHYARYVPGVFAKFCDQVTDLLRKDFPIDVLIAHLHDANEGSMERRMQSCLLGIHAASEAWNRANAQTTVLKKEAWDGIKDVAAKAALATIANINSDLSESVERAVLGANNVGTNARLRAFLKALSLKAEGATKKAIELRNVLFHDGYLQRRFSSLSPEKQQERYDQVQILREFLTRIIFALCDVDVVMHSIVSPLTSIPVKDSPSREMAG